MTVPLDTWIQIQVVAPLGESAGHWTLSVTLPGDKPQTFDDLGLISPDWKTLDWVGLIAIGEEASEIWIDDFELTR